MFADFSAPANPSKPASTPLPGTFIPSNYPHDFLKTHTKEWENSVRERYGAPPSITYFECPVVVDNVMNQIVSDS
jgi:hypothetical protein